MWDKAVDRIFDLATQHYGTRQEFADALGVKPCKVASWRGKKSSSYCRVIRKIAALFDTTPEALIIGDKAAAIEDARRMAEERWGGVESVSMELIMSHDEYGNDEPVVLTRFKGGSITNELPRLGVVQCDEAVSQDHGPTRGCAWSYTMHRDFTPEERAAGRARLLETVERALTEQGLW